MFSLLSAPNALLSAPALPTNSKLASSRIAEPSMKWGESLGSAEERKWNTGPDGRASQLTRDHGKLVITLATTGNINTRDNNPSLPCTPKEMADDMHECIKAGVSVLHIHARNELLRPTMRVDKFRETVRLIKERDPDAVIQISTGGRAPPVQFEGVEVGNWRMDPLNLMPEMASYTPGSVNLGPIVYQNDAKLTKDMAQRFTDTGIKPQVEVFDTNMITNAYNLVKAGLLKKPLDFGLVMGAPNAQECSLRQLGHLISMIEPGDTWTSIGIGKFEMPLAYMAIAMGGHVRVGLEDNNKSPDGKVCTNLELVQHVVEVAKAMGREIASPEEAREILSMPKENADWILAKLDPSVKLESLVSNMTPYQGLEPIEGSLEMAPSKAHPDSPEGLSLPAYDAGLVASRK
jgi:3-keto-5-aminohexanoate cleavage enzyme